MDTHLLFPRRQQATREEDMPTAQNTTSSTSSSIFENLTHTIGTRFGFGGKAAGRRAEIAAAEFLYDEGVRHHWVREYAQATRCLTECLNLLGNKAGAKVLHALGRSQYALAVDGREKQSLATIRQGIEEAVVCFRQASEMSKDGAPMETAEEAYRFLSDTEQAFRMVEVEIAQVERRIASARRLAPKSDLIEAMQALNEAKFNARHFGLAATRAALRKATDITSFI